MDCNTILLQILVVCILAVAALSDATVADRNLVDGTNEEVPHLVEDDPMPISSMIPEEDLIYSSGYFQGDMMMTEAEIAERYGAAVAAQARQDGETLNVGDDEGRTLGAARAGRRKWPGSIIYYQFESAYPEDLKRIVRDSLGDYAALTNVAAVEGTGSGNYVLIREGSGCSSRVGMSRGAQSMSIARGCRRKGTILHEFMHALGFSHEHTAPDRDTFVAVNLANVQEGKKHNFNKITGSLAVSNSYDYSSVMHYSEFAFSKPSSGKTIDCRGNSCGQRSGFSSKDRDDINKMYPMTASRTPNPTRFPTRNPTRFPTRNPTSFPTRNPTRFPTRNPTRFPTRNPTSFPTRNPTRFPTRNPTRFPTRNPTRFPTRNPTRFPTRNPTRFPTRNPTRFPNRNPTRIPTNSPTAFPIQVPTSSPVVSKPSSSPVTKTPSVSPPQGWTCNSSGYDAEDGCSCECGAVDPDCAKPRLESNANLFCGDNLVDASKFRCTSSNVCAAAVSEPPDDGSGNFVLLATGGFLAVSALAMAAMVIRGKRNRVKGAPVADAERMGQFAATRFNPVTTAKPLTAYNPMATTNPMTQSLAPVASRIETPRGVPRRPPRPKATQIPKWSIFPDDY